MFWCCGEREVREMAGAGVDEPSRGRATGDHGHRGGVLGAGAPDADGDTGENEGTGAEVLGEGCALGEADRLMLETEREWELSW